MPWVEESAMVAPSVVVVVAMAVTVTAVRPTALLDS
jgi:hypothetical protein